MFWWENEGALGPVAAESRSKADVLRGIVTDRLSTAAREILAEVERTVAEYEEEAAGFRQEIDRQRQALGVLLESQVKTEPTNVCPVEPQLCPVIAVKEEEEEAGGAENPEPVGRVWNDPQLCPVSEHVPGATVVKEDGNEEAGGKENPGQDQHVWSEELFNRVYAECQNLPVKTPGKIVEEGDGGGGGESPEEDDHLSYGEFENLGLISYIEEDDDEGEELPPFQGSSKQRNKRPRPLPRSGTRTSLRLRMSDPKELIQLSMCVLPDPHITEVTPSELRAYPPQEVSCPVGLQQEDFLDLLRVTFPQINNKPFDLFWTDDSRKLLPLRVETLTAEEIQRNLKNTDQSVYIRLQGEEESNITAVSSRPVATNTTKMRFVAQSRARKGTENGQGFIDLEILIPDDSDVDGQSSQVRSSKRVKVVRCPLGLTEEDFVSQLKSLFPQLAGNTIIELFHTKYGSDLIPVNATKLTPEEIWKFISADGPGSTLCVQKKATRPAAVDIAEDVSSPAHQETQMDQTSYPENPDQQGKMPPDEEDITDEDGCISFKAILITNPNIRFCSRKALKRFRSRVVQCPLGLQEEDFLSQLRSTFPELNGDVPFELFSICDNRKMIPLDVMRQTPEKIRRFIIYSGNTDTRLYIQLKTEESKSIKEQPKQGAQQEKKNLPFRVRILEDPSITCLHHMPSHLVSNLKKFKCRADLDVLGFRRMLKRKFQRLRDGLYEFLKCNTQGDLVPLRVDEETSENMHRALRSGTLFIRFKVPSGYTGNRRRRRASSGAGRQRWSAAKVKRQKFEIIIDDANDDAAFEWMIPPARDGDDGDADAEKLEEAWGEQMVQGADHTVTSDTMEPDQTPDMETQSLVSLSCKVCGVRQRKKSLLTKHAVGHIDDPRTMCGVCGMHLSSAETLRKHLLGHQTIHVCDTCGKSFVTVNGLQKHSVSHTAQRPHTCHICHKTFALESVMKTHLRFHDEHKPARCKFCHKAFTTQSQLKSHSSVHSTERPYMCIVCGKALKSVNTLSAHIRTHTRHGMVDKTCKVCGMKFYSLAHLNTHMKTHKM